MSSFLKSAALSILFCSASLTGAVEARAAGDAAAGEKVFRQCKACHKIGDGAKNATGPALTSVVGRTAGAAEGFKYSPSLKAAGAAGLVWTEETLTNWLMDPSAYMKVVLDDASAKSKMKKKLKKEAQIADVIAYLATFSTAAAPLAAPKVAAAGVRHENADAPLFAGPGMRTAEDSKIAQPGDSDFEVAVSGRAEDLEFMNRVIAKMKGLRLWDGPEAIHGPFYTGLRPHGVILDTLYTSAEIDGRVGELVVKRSYEHPEAETNAAKALTEVQANPDAYLSNYAIMYRREAGYQDAHNNWFYAEFGPKGEVIVYEGAVLAGRSDLCVSCHALADGDDYFFTTDAIK